MQLKEGFDCSTISKVMDAKTTPSSDVIPAREADMAPCLAI